MNSERFSSARCGVVLVVGAVAACSLVVDADRQQCATSVDCLGHGLGDDVVCIANACARPTVATDAGADVDAEPVDPIWGCLGNLPALPAEDPATTVPFTTAFEYLIAQKVLSGLPVKACRSDDIDCANPLPGTPKETGEDGRVTLDLYDGFRGYLEIDTARYSDLMLSRVQVLPVPDKDALSGRRNVRWGLLTKAEVAYIASNAGKPFREDYGHVFFVTSDCRGLAGADLSVRAEPVTSDTYTFYTDAAGTPSLTQTKSSQSGNAGIVNLPVGEVTLTLSREGGQRVSRQTINVRPNRITYMNFGPSPL